MMLVRRILAGFGLRILEDVGRHFRELVAAIYAGGVTD